MNDKIDSDFIASLKGRTMIEIELGTLDKEYDRCVLENCSLKNGNLTLKGANSHEDSARFYGSSESGWSMHVDHDGTVYLYGGPYLGISYIILPLKKNTEVG